jgi:hypothetical protein
LNENGNSNIFPCQYPKDVRVARPLRPNDGPFSFMTSLSVSTATATALEELSKMTTIFIDRGDLFVVAQYTTSGLITDATTDPLFVSQAGDSGDKRYADMVFDAIMYAKKQMGGGESPLANSNPRLMLPWTTWPLV